MYGKKELLTKLLIFVSISHDLISIVITHVEKSHKIRYNSIREEHGKYDVC